jgi:MFS family permease
MKGEVEELSVSDHRDKFTPGGAGNIIHRIFADHYPWMVVAISFLLLAVSYGLRGAFSVFLVAFLDEFGSSRSSTAGIFTLCYVIWAVVSPLVGTFVDRWGVRLTFLAGGVLLLLGLMLTSMATEFWQLFLFFGGFFSLGLALLDIIPITSYVDQWHVRSKGKAFGLAFSGRGIGHLLMLPFSQYLISLVGWRHAFRILGGLLFGIILSLSLGVRGRNGASVADSSQKPPLAADSSVTTGQALRTLQFWRLFTLRFFTSYGVYAVSVHLVAFLTDIGHSKLYGATVTGLIGVLGFGGAIILGYLSDHLGRGRAMIIGFISSSMGVACLLLAHVYPWQGVIVLFLFFFGMGYGARGPVFAALASDLFSGRSLGRIYGLITLGVGLGEAAGPWMAGYFFDRTGNYLTSFLSVVVSFAISIALTVGIEKMGSKPAAVNA